jgi:hypothetical protein
VSFSSALSSMFGGSSNSHSHGPSRRSSNPASLSSSSPSSLATDGNSPYSNLNREVKQQALAAVLLEEWLLELAAIAQEQSVLQKEQAFEVGMGLKPDAKAMLQGSF